MLGSLASVPSKLVLVPSQWMTSPQQPTGKQDLQICTPNKRRQACARCQKKPGFRHTCVFCMRWFCPACVEYHACWKWQPSSASSATQRYTERRPHASQQAMELSTSNKRRQACRNCLKRPGFKHTCAFCMQWFCPTCVRCHACCPWQTEPASSPAQPAAEVYDKWLECEVIIGKRPRPGQS